MGNGSFTSCPGVGSVRWLSDSSNTRFSAAPEPAEPVNNLRTVPNQHFSPRFQATIEATESAILNSLLGATTMTGRSGNTAHALTAAAIFQVMEAHGQEAQLLNG